MVNKLFKSFFAVMMVLGSALGFVACEEQGDDVVANPTVEVSTTSINFAMEEGSQTVDVTANADWKTEVNADWVTVTPSAGNGNATITVAVAANDTGAVREATVSVIALHKTYGKWDTKKIKVIQSASEDVPVTEELLYGDNFDGKEATKEYGNSNSSWPYIDQFPEFANPTGTAAENVTYSGSGVSVRANSTSDSSYSDYAGSGLNNIFFGGGAYFQINDISLDASQLSYKMTFGSEKYTQDGDSTFKNSEFLLYISKNGEEWAPVEYTFAGTEPGRWNVATANFTLAAGTEVLYVKFEAKVASVYRLDDVKLYVGNGGQTIDLDNIEVVTPEPPTTDALYYENFDGKAASQDSNNYWPYLADFPEMKNAVGSAAANVSYEGYNTTVRNNSNSDGSYSDYAGSGVNNIFFGKDNAWIMIKDLTLESSQKNLTLTFGTEKYSQSLGSVFTPSEFIVTISGDGQKWSNVEYTFAGTAEGRWNVATANFTLKEVPAKLYIKFMATAESAYRLDDVTLNVGEGGQQIDLGEGISGGGDEPSNPDQPNVPANGEYESDSAFVCNADDSTNAAYTLGATTIGGQTVTGFKLGKSKQAGKFISGAVSVSGEKYLNFYAQGWKDGDVTLYFRVDGGATMSQKLASHDGVTGNPPYISLAFAETDHYSIKLTGLTESSKIEFSTDANFALTSADSTMSSARAIVCGVKLTDEPLGAGDGGETPNPEPDPGPDPTPGDVTTIAEVLALGQNVTINAVIEAVVVSNYELNNLTSKKGMYVQDATGALQFYLASNHEYAFGTKLQIDLNGATLGAYNGAVQVSGLSLDKITVISTGNAVTPKTVSMADYLANKYEGQYIALEGVQVAAADLSKTWVMGGAHTSIAVEDASGNSFVVFSSKYASYGAATVSQGSGTIKGISSVNNGTMQLIFAQDSDYAGLTGARFDGGASEPDPEPTPDPENPTTGDSATIDFNDANNRKSYSEQQQVWQQNGITVTNDKASSTSNVGDFVAPARFYKSSKLTVAADKAFSQIVFYCDDYKNTYPTDLQNSITSGTATVDGTVVTVTLSAATTSYSINSLAGQVRVDSLTVVYAE